MNNSKVPHSTDQSLCHNQSKNAKLMTKQEFLQMTLEDSHASNPQPIQTSWHHKSVKTHLNSSKAANSNTGQFSYQSHKNTQGDQLLAIDKHSQSSTNSEDERALQPILQQIAVNPKSDESYHKFNQTQNSKNTLQLINEPHVMTNSSEQKPKHDDTVENVYPSSDLPRQQKLKAFELFVWGLNDKYQLGQLCANSPNQQVGAFQQAVLIPRKQKDINFIPVNIACGSQHTLLLSHDGHLWGVGSNKYCQLGHDCRSSQVFYFIKPISFNKNQGQIQSIACGEKHSVVLMDDGRCFVSGSNSEGQLGMALDPNSGNTIEQFTEIQPPLQYVEKVACGNFTTAFLDQTNQTIIVCGNLAREQDLFTPVLVPHQIKSEGDRVVDIKCGDDSLLLLTKNGKVFVKRGNEGFVHLNQISSAKEIEANGANYGALTFDNLVFTWSEGGHFNLQIMEIEAKNSVMLSRLSLGSDFGHVVDEESNLYGWGNNKNGELGTGDSYPRYKVSQIRIFNEQRQYMRCHHIFSGHSFCMGLFESNSSPNGIVSTSKHSSNHRTIPQQFDRIIHHKHQSDGSSYAAQSIKPVNMLTIKNSDLSNNYKPPNSSRIRSTENDLEMQYIETEVAIQKYREQALNYKENIQRIRAQMESIDKDKDPSTMKHHSSLKMPQQSSMRARSSNHTPVEFQSLNQPENVQYSPAEGINYFEDQKFDERMIRTQNWENVRKSSKQATNNYSFSQLSYKFDEGKEVLQVYHDKSREAERERSWSRSKQREEMARGSVHSNDYCMNQPPEDHMRSIGQEYNVADRPPMHSNENKQRRIAEAIPPAEKTRNFRGREMTHGPFSNRVLNMQSLEQAPTVTAIQASQQKMRSVSQKKGTTSPNELQNIIENSISSTSSALIRSRKSRSLISNMTKVMKPMNEPEIPYQNGMLSPNNPSSRHQNQTSILNTFRFPTLKNQTPDISASTMTNPLNKQSSKETYDLSISNINTSQQRSTTDLIPKNLSSFEVNMRQHPYYNNYVQHYPDNGHLANSSTNLDISVTKSTLDYPPHRHSLNAAYTANNEGALKQKLSKYKKKLKKYIKQSKGMMVQIEQLRHEKDKLQKQNMKIITAEHIEEQRLKAILHEEQFKREEAERHFTSIMQQKQVAINTLTQENMHMMEDIKDRDRKHQELEAKLEFVDQEILNITQQIAMKNGQIQDLERENKDLLKQLNDIRVMNAEQQRIIFSTEQQLEEERSRSRSNSRNRIPGAQEGKSLQRRNHQLETKLHKLSSNIAELKNQLFLAQQENRQKDEQLMVKKGEIHQMKKKYGHQKKVSKRLEMTVTDLQTKLDDFYRDTSNTNTYNLSSNFINSKGTSQMENDFRRLGETYRMPTNKMSTIEEAQGPQESIEHEGYHTFKDHEPVNIMCQPMQFSNGQMLSQQTFNNQQMGNPDIDGKRLSQTTFKNGDSITVYTQNENRNQFIDPSILNDSLHILNDNSSNFEAVNPQSKYPANKELNRFNLQQLNQNSSMKPMDLLPQMNKSNDFIDKSGEHQIERTLFQHENSEVQVTNRLQAELATQIQVNQPELLNQNQAQRNNNFVPQSLKYYNGVKSFDADLVQMQSAASTYQHEGRNHQKLAHTLQTFPSNKVYSPHTIIISNPSRENAGANAIAESPHVVYNNQQELPQQIMSSFHQQQSDKPPQEFYNCQQIQSVKVLNGPHMLNGGKGYASGISFPSSIVDQSNFNSKRNGDTSQRSPKQQQQLKFADLTESQKQLAFNYVKQEYQSANRQKPKSNGNAQSSGAPRPSLQSTISKPPDRQALINSENITNANKSQGFKSQNISMVQEGEEDGDKSATSYKDSILNKFQNRTTQKLSAQRQNRVHDKSNNRSDVSDNASRSNSAIDDRNLSRIHMNNDHSLNQVNLCNVKNERSMERDGSNSKILCNSQVLEERVNDFKSLSCSRLQTQQVGHPIEKKDRIAEFKEVSKHWQQRRGRSESTNNLSQKEIKNKYQEAFRNLNQELKRKMGLEPQPGPAEGAYSFRERQQFNSKYTSKND